ncbi:hypothetical protein BH23BAC3_BH23BAC3_20200 [soil metagenome]
MPYSFSVEIYTTKSRICEQVINEICAFNERQRSVNVNLRKYSDRTGNTYTITTNIYFPNERLILKGNGEGNFEPMSGTESDIKIYGEQRGAALADFNQNGKTDLVVT